MNGTGDLPHFRYHPDPIRTGAIVQSSDECECCGQRPGWAVKKPIYCEDEVETICPGCVADGSAAEKFHGSFNDDQSLIGAGLDKAIVDEVCKRTPSYECWQQESWIACCDDACEFHGEAAKESLLALDQDGLMGLSAEAGLDFNDLVEMLKDYAPGGSPAVYHFVCRHCKAAHYNADFD